MSALSTASIIALGIYGGFLLGRWGQNRLPGHHLSKESQDTVKLGAGLIATMAALVLGLLVSSAKNSFDAMNAGIASNCARALYLDHLLADYGPEAQPTRKQIRRSIEGNLARIWPEKTTGDRGLKAAEESNLLLPIEQGVHQLEPKTDLQRALLAQARQITGDMLQTRLLTIEQQQGSLPVVFLVLLSVWISLLFFTFGIFAPHNPTVAAVMAICAISVASAIFLILEMDQPLDGIIKASPAPLQKALLLLGQ